MSRWGFSFLPLLRIPHADMEPPILPRAPSHPNPAAELGLGLQCSLLRGSPGPQHPVSTECAVLHHGLSTFCVQGMERIWGQAQALSP